MNYVLNLTLRPYRFSSIVFYIVLIKSWDQINIMTQIVYNKRTLEHHTQPKSGLPYLFNLSLSTWIPCGGPEKVFT